MSRFPERSDHMLPQPPVRSPEQVLIWVVIALQVLIALGAFPFLPSAVPLHYGINGQATSYAPKWVPTILFPGLSVAAWLLRVRQIAGPHLGGNTQQAVNLQWRSMLFLGILLFLLVFQTALTARALGRAIDLSLLMQLGLAVLSIFLGNYLGKLRRNFWMGIRTPWTLVSDQVWERTHRLGGWLFVAAGMLGVPLSLASGLRPWGMLLLMMMVAVTLVVYSYACFRQQTARHHKPGLHRLMRQTRTADSESREDVYR